MPPLSICLPTAGAAAKPDLTPLLPSRRVAIVPMAVAMPSVDDMLKTLEARRRARGERPLIYHDQQRCKQRLESLVAKAMADFPTVKDLPKDKREPIRKLARLGAEVLGPSNLADVDQLASELHADAPWLRGVSRFIMMRLRANIEAGQLGLILPAILLVGEPGCGKSQYARRLAEIACLPSRRIDVGSGSAGFRVSGLEKGWASAAPGLPVETVLATRIANPLIVVDEIDKAGTFEGVKGGATSVTISLLEMLETTTAAEFECPAYCLPFDLSRVVWVLTANVLNKVPEPIRDRCRVFHVPNPSPEDLLAVFDRQTRNVMDQDLASHARDVLHQNLCKDVMSLRQLRAFIEAVLAFSTRPQSH